MPSETIAIAGLLILFLAAAVFKGSRVPQTAEGSRVHSSKQGRVSFAIIPVICAGLSYGALHAFASLSERGAGEPSSPIRLVFALMIVGPWFFGAYFAFLVARGRDLAMRTVGVLEFAFCLFYGCAYLFAICIGFA